MMMHASDRNSHKSNGAAFMTGWATGTLIGAGLAFLFAPKRGTELRRQISKSADKLHRRASDACRDASQKVNDIMEKGREVYRAARAH